MFRSNYSSIFEQLYLLFKYTIRAKIKEINDHDPLERTIREVWLSEDYVI